MPKREIVKRIDQLAATSGGAGTGGGASGNADTVDGLHASRAATPGALLALGSDAQFPAGVVALADVDGVTLDAPTDNEMLAYDEASGQWINQTAAEAGLQPTLTTGDLAASAPLRASATRQVIGGDVTLSLDQSGIDHGTIGGLGDDDHTQYLLASGARAGASTQAQDFGTHGIKTDVVIESTVDAGVMVEGIVLKDGGATFAADVNFASFKAIALACDRGTNFPSSPAWGQWFLHTTSNCLFMYDGSAWKPIISFGDITLYVDGTNGSDAPGQGIASGSGATATIQYAINLIPAIVGGDVTINIAGGTYTENLTIGSRIILGNYYINLVGTKTTLVSGTITNYKRTLLAVQTGKVNTVSGGSTTITLSGGGSTSVFWVGAIIKANNVARRVIGIIDSTTFTVDSAVDWYNGGSGYSWYLLQSMIEDSSASWADDAFNGNLLCSNTSDPDNNLVFIRDTFGATKRIVTAGPMAATPTPGSTQYAVYQLETTIRGMVTNWCSRVRFKYLILNGGSELNAYQHFFVTAVIFYGVEIEGAISYGIYITGGKITIYGAYIHSSRGIYFWNGGSGYLHRLWLATPHYNLYCYDRAQIIFQYSEVDSTYASDSSIRVSTLSGISNYANSVFFVSGNTTGMKADILSILSSVTIATGVAFGKYTTNYSIDSTTYAIAT